MPKRVYFLLPYAEHIAPSQRFRVEAFYGLLNRNGITYKAGKFWTRKGNQILYQEGKIGWKAFYLIRGIVARFWHIFAGIINSDYVFIHREAAPIGPPFFEWLVAKVLRKKIIYDFDDAIWIPNISAGNQVASALKAFWKVGYICKWSYKVSVGNRYLGEWASNFNTAIVYNPTCVDMENRYSTLKDHDSEVVRIGWTGSRSTLKYLDQLKPVLEKLEQNYAFEFVVICDKEPDWKLKSLRFIPWKEESEINDLLKINIGVMPLEDDAWSEGKCGFKLIQFLALGIPAVASPVGVNREIIEQGVNGYLCLTLSEWESALLELLKSQTLRTKLGLHGHTKMKKHFSVESNSANFLSLFS